MRTAAIIISMVVALLIAVTTSWGLEILLALSCVVYQYIHSYGRVQSFKTPGGAMFCGVIVRNGVFLIPLGGALLSGLWIVAVAIVVVFGMNLFMS